MFNSIAWGQSIAVRTNGSGQSICFINPKADHDKGIPTIHDRCTAALIVEALNEYERTHFNRVADLLSASTPKDWLRLHETIK